jgi:hypothetical protein
MIDWLFQDVSTILYFPISTCTDDPPCHIPAPQVVVVQKIESFKHYSDAWQSAEVQLFPTRRRVTSKMYSNNGEFPNVFEFCI